MSLNQKSLTVDHAYETMSKLAHLIASGKLSESEDAKAHELLVLIETVIIGLLYLEYPNVVMNKIGPVIKKAVARIHDGYVKEKGPQALSSFYMFLMRNSYRNGIYCSLATGVTEDESKAISDEAVTNLMEIRKELDDKPSKHCASVVFGIFASSVKGAGGAIAYDQEGKPADEDMLLRGIASQSAAGLLAYKSFLMDVAASENVELEGKHFKAACLDDKFAFTDDADCGSFVSAELASHSMGALIDASDRFASLSLGIAESASFKSSFDLEKGVQEKAAAYARECGDDKAKLVEKLSSDPEISDLAKICEKRFDDYAHDPKTNASKSASVFASGALDILGRVRSVLVTSKE